MLGEHWPSAVSRLDKAFEADLTEYLQRMFPDQEWTLIVRQPDPTAKAWLGVSSLYDEPDDTVARTVETLQAVSTTLYRHGLIERTDGR